MSKLTLMITIVSGAVLGIYMVAGGGESETSYFENRKQANSGISNEERRKNEIFMRILKSSAGIKDE